MPRISRKIALAAAVILMTVPALAGCAPETTLGAPPTQSTIAASTVTPSPTATTATTATPTPAASTPSKNPPPPPPPPSGGLRICDATSFTIEYIATDGSAGKQHGILTFRNKSGAPCRAHGFPIAAFIGTDGRQVGATSEFDGASSTSPITIPNGESLTAPITFSDADVIQDCTIVQVTKLSVTPPEASNSVVITIPETDACANVETGLITVGVVSLG